MDNKEITSFINDVCDDKSTDKWLIFFYSLPSRPISKRMKIWRRLIKAGSLHFRGSVYILPLNNDNLEFFQWLISEISVMGGEASFVRVRDIERVKNIEIKALFNKQRDKEYRLIAKGLDEILRMIKDMKKKATVQDMKRLLAQFNKFNREYEEINRIDFFNAPSGVSTGKKVKAIITEMNKIKGTEPKKERPARVLPRSIDEFKGKIWVTRKGPFVDRMSSAWLVRKFIDEGAVFEFIDEDDLEGLDDRFVSFDIQGGSLTHIGNLCTFEALINTFCLKSKALKRIAEIVHELDIKDGKYKVPEAKGIEDILIGLRKTAKDDLEALEKGIALFDVLYASKS